jgi:hypothetical protein
MLGRFFRDPAQLERTPAAVRGKLERLAAPMAKVEGLGEGWSLTDAMQGALDLIEEARSRDLKNIDDVVKASGLYGSQVFSPQAVVLAKRLQAMTPLALVKAMRAYAQDARFASEGSGLFGDPPTAAEAFEDAFGK